MRVESERTRKALRRGAIALVLGAAAVYGVLVGMAGGTRASESYSPIGNPDDPQAGFDVDKWASPNLFRVEPKSARMGPNVERSYRNAAVYMQDKGCRDVVLSHIPDVGLIISTSNGAACKPETRETP